ncbi:MAG: N-acetyltransferase domain-containing protein [Lachnoclostridium sp.]|jgi:predicted GNAT family N-acyltransferase
MVQGKYLHYGDDLSEVMNIRRKVFVEEQGISEEEEFDEYDDQAIHALVYDVNNEKRPVATGRVYYDGNHYRIGKIAVLKEERGKYYGDFVVRLLINKAFLSGAEEVVVSAQKKVVPFYEKIGFKTYGESYEEAGTEHILMKVKLDTVCTKCKEHN